MCWLDWLPTAGKGDDTVENIRDWIEIAAKFFEALAVVLMVGFIVIGTARWLFLSSRRIEKAYQRYRVHLGKALLVGLELLVAADIIRTVALDLTPLSIATLAALVLVRTFLGWTLSVEVEGRWPWQKREEAGSGTKEGIDTTLPQCTTALAGEEGAKTERRE
jgi:uncharacterized membrane protein